MPIVELEPDRTLVRLLVYVSAEPGTIDENEVNAWIPSPAALLSMEPNYIKVLQLSDLTSLGARAFYKLGRDDDAEEICRLAIAPERNTLKRTSL